MTLTREDYEALVAGRKAKELVDMYTNAERLGHLHGLQVIMGALSAKMGLWTAIVWGSTHVAHRASDGIITIYEREAFEKKWNGGEA